MPSLSRLCCCFQWPFYRRFNPRISNPRYHRGRRSPTRQLASTQGTKLLSSTSTADQNIQYTQNLDVLEVSADVPFDEEFTNAIQALVELWVLADKLLIRRLQNDAMRQIQALSDKFAVLATKCLHYVYENTGKDSPLRKVFIYQVAWESELDILEQARKDIPEEMLWDVVAFMIKATSDSGVGYIMMKECKEGGYLVNEDL